MFTIVPSLAMDYFTGLDITGKELPNFFRTGQGLTAGN